MRAWSFVLDSGFARYRLRPGMTTVDLSRVMPGFMPGIHVFMRQTRRDVDDRNKSGHDVESCRRHFDCAGQLAALTLHSVLQILTPTTARKTGRKNRR
jgi:hypothetical protein